MGRVSNLGFKPWLGFQVVFDNRVWVTKEGSKGGFVFQIRNSSQGWGFKRWVNVRGKASNF